MKKEEGVLPRDHYRYFYVAHFGLDDAYYRDKVILDIGCGPCGSLEWASMASRRIGLDPLAREYLQLGANLHKMEYIDSPAENIPMKDAECDAVFSFNSLDHVENVDLTVKEIKRVTRPRGIFLLLLGESSAYGLRTASINPKQVIESLRPEFICESLQVYKPVVEGLYESICADEKISQPEDTKERGYMSAKFVRATI